MVKLRNPAIKKAFGIALQNDFSILQNETASISFTKAQKKQQMHWPQEKPQNQMDIYSYMEYDRRKEIDKEETPYCEIPRTEREDCSPMQGTKQTDQVLLKERQEIVCKTALSWIRGISWTERH